MSVVKQRHVRRIGPGDMDQVCDLERQCFAHDWTREELAKVMFAANTRAYCLLNAQTKEMLGYTVAQMLGPVVWVSTIAVRSDVRRQRIGSDMMVHVLNGADELEIPVATHCADYNAEANAFLRSQGFRCNGIQRKFFRITNGQRCDAIKFLRQVPEVPK